MSYKCDSCDAKIIVGEHMQIPRRPCRSKGDGQGDLDLRLCTKCYLGAKRFIAFKQFIITKQFLKERMKDMNLKHHKRFMFGLTKEEQEEREQKEYEEYDEREDEE